MLSILVQNQYKIRYNVQQLNPPFSFWMMTLILFLVASNSRTCSSLYLLISPWNVTSKWSSLVPWKTTPYLQNILTMSKSNSILLNMYTILCKSWKMYIINTSLWLKHVNLFSISLFQGHLFIGIYFIGIREHFI